MPAIKVSTLNYGEFAGLGGENTGEETVGIFHTPSLRKDKTQ
jgi:hypothetical protein